MGKEKKEDEFHGQSVFQAAYSVSHLLVIAYALNAVVYSIGLIIFILVRCD
jgi:hypothetical protein